MFGLRLGKLGAAIKAGTGSVGVVPLFSRDYEATGSLGADATFTRASTATYVDSNGVIQTAAINTPRFDYSTGSRALLMEPAATNLVANSQSSTWTQVGSCTMVSSGTISGIPAYNLSGCTAKWHRRLFYSGAPNAPVFYVSVFVLSGSAGRLQIKDENSGLESHVAFDGIGGVTTPLTGAGGITATSVAIDGGFRVSAAFTPTTQANTFSANIGPYTTSAAVVLNCTGAQLEAGSTITSYIPTSGSAVTRAAESLSYSGIAADNETRAITDAGTVDVDDWDGIVDATINGADNIAQISSITVYTTGERPA